MHTPFTELVGCRYPLQQAGMGTVAGVELAAAVSAAGALGMLGAAGYAPDALGAVFDEIARHTPGPVGANFLMPFVDPEAVDVAAARARLVEFFYDQPDAELVERVHGGGALAAWQVGSVDEALAAEAAGCDVVVAQGIEAGGHVRGTQPLTALLPQVLDAVTVPVVASGGIGTASDVARVLEAGAAAARVGTRFVATVEANAHRRWQDLLVGARPDDTVLTTAFSVMWPDAPHRVLHSAVAAAEADGRDVVGESEIGGMRMPVPRLSVGCPDRYATGNVDAMALYAGRSAGAVVAVLPAADVVAELVADLAT